jgi:hypothetical protein
VRITDLSISAVPESAERDVGLLIDRGTAARIEFANLRLDKSPVTPFVTNVPAGTFITTNWTQDGQPLGVSSPGG